MTDPGSQTSWLHRRPTRRDAVKSALAALAALTLPTLRPSRARAEFVSVSPCFTGCNWFNHKLYFQDKASCLGNQPVDFVGGYFYTVNLGIFGLGLTRGLIQVGKQRCVDQSMLDQKVRNSECLQPNCSGFDPKQPGGPCDGCGQNCCVCPATPTGYICCFYQCDDPDHNCCGS